MDSTLVLRWRPRKMLSEHRVLYNTYWITSMLLWSSPCQTMYVFTEFVDLLWNMLFIEIRMLLQLNHTTLLSYLLYLFYLIAFIAFDVIPNKKYSRKIPTKKFQNVYFSLKIFFVFENIVNILNVDFSLSQFYFSMTSMLLR